MALSLGLIHHPCRTIVQAQVNGSAAVPSWFDVPEPWSGHIETAPLLFVSSNPSIDKRAQIKPGEVRRLEPDREQYPDCTWDSASRVAFFEDRFTGNPPFVRDGLYALKNDGHHRTQPVRFWGAVRARAREVMPEPRPGVDYALTEVVHCKTESEAGVRQALDTCARKWLGRVLSASGAKVIVVLGRPAKRAVQVVFRDRFPEGDLTGVLHRGAFGAQGIDRLVVFLPHPNARMRRTFEACVAPDDLALLRTALRPD